MISLFQSCFSWKDKTGFSLGQVQQFKLYCLFIYIHYISIFVCEKTPMLFGKFSDVHSVKKTQQTEQLNYEIHYKLEIITVYTKE